MRLYSRASKHSALPPLPPKVLKNPSEEEQQVILKHERLKINGRSATSAVAVYFRIAFVPNNRLPTALPMLVTANYILGRITVSSPTDWGSLVNRCLSSSREIRFTFLKMRLSLFSTSLGKKLIICFILSQIDSAF